MCVCVGSLQRTVTASAATAAVAAAAAAAVAPVCYLGQASLLLAACCLFHATACYLLPAAACYCLLVAAAQLHATISGSAISIF